MVVAPAPINVEVFLQVAFLAEARVGQYFAGRRVVGQVRRRDAVQTHAREGMIHAKSTRNGADAAAVITRMDPVADPAFTDRTVLDIA